YYDVWLPLLAPSTETVKLGLSATTEREWQRYARKYRAEMARPDPRVVLDLLAALSHAVSFSVGCYCEDERHCHRSILREILQQRGAAVV
ncbi:MAG TPA: DUF488 family protein, partial [Candidatus Krumholzibacteria bacterium]|nr:DUF488 family protein [Candidatus Krumholzibacteria bacterium]